MRLIGWGHEEKDGYLYWIGQNQWSEEWGDKGLVKIKAREINIDNWSVSCVPDL
jgi:hypothetical protein